MAKLYLCDITNLIEKVKADENCMAAYFVKLGPARVEEIMRKNKAEDRVRSMAASLLLLFALEEEGYGIEHLPSFTYKKNKKPYLKEFPGLFFNLSHAKNMVVCVTAEHEVGVDIEYDRIMTEAAVQRIFTKREQEVLGENRELLIPMWTAKEAYAKTMGRGIADIWSGVEIIEDNTGKYVEKLNQDITNNGLKDSEELEKRKPFRYPVIAEGKITDVSNGTYYYSVCVEASDGAVCEAPVILNW